MQVPKQSHHRPLVVLRPLPERTILSVVLTEGNTRRQRRNLLRIRQMLSSPRKTTLTFEKASMKMCASSAPNPSSSTLWLSAIIGHVMSARFVFEPCIRRWNALFARLILLLHSDHSCRRVFHTQHSQPNVIFTISPSKPYEEYKDDSIPYSDDKLNISFETNEMMEETLILLRFARLRICAFAFQIDGSSLQIQLSQLGLHVHRDRLG